MRAIALPNSHGSARPGVVFVGFSTLFALACCVTVLVIMRERWTSGLAPLSPPPYASGIYASGIYPARTGEHFPLSLVLVTPTAALTLTGEQAGNLYGRALAAAGDVNNDGYADLVVGASRYMSSTGRAYLYLGGPNGPTQTPALTLTGEFTGDLYGVAVSTAGDVNHDGYADVIVGASFATAAGRAYLYRGGPAGLSSTPAFTLTGQQPGDAFGATAATAGDVNGDGYADIIVGAFQYPSGNSTGRAYVYMGSSGGLTVTPAVTLTGENAGDGFSIPVASAGDINNDGYADVIVGAPNYGSLRGRAYLYMGGPAGLAATPALTLTGENAGDALGDSVATAGDLNGDGYYDVVVGAPGFPGSNAMGRVYVFMGGLSGLSAAPALTLTGEGIQDSFGMSVATAGDVNNDGYADVIIGARNYSGGAGMGRAYLFLGGPAGLSPAPVLTLTGENTGNFFGRRVVGAGDVNHDGASDFAISADGYGSNTGRVYMFLGGRGVLTSTLRLFLPLVIR